MELIKKYWWILAAAVVFMMMGKKKKARRRTRRAPMSRMRRAGVRMSGMRRMNSLGGYRSYAGLSRRRSARRMRRK